MTCIICVMRIEIKENKARCTFARSFLEVLIQFWIWFWVLLCFLFDKFSL